MFGSLPFSFLFHDLSEKGLVFGPDKKLYVSLFNPAARLEGFIIRYTENLMYDCIFASFTSPGCSQYLHRPEGLTFGPDGKFYVTAFIDDNNATDVDKILVFNMDGTCDDTRLVKLWQIGEPRRFGQYFIFGPDNALYVCVN